MTYHLFIPANEWIAYLLGAIVVLCVGLAILSLQRRNRPGVRFFGRMMFLAGFWAFTELMGMYAPTLEAKTRWSQISYFSIALIPVLWFFFCLAYTGRLGNIPRKYRAFFSGGPVAHPGAGVDE